MQDIERLRRQVKVVEGNDIRTIYLGFDPEVDRLIDLVKTEMDTEKRDAAIHQAYAIVAQEFGYIPLHHQVIPWAMQKTSMCNIAPTMHSLSNGSR